MSILKKINFKIAIPSVLLGIGVITLIITWPLIIDGIRQIAQNNAVQTENPGAGAVNSTESQQRYQDAVAIASENQGEAQALLDEALTEATTNEERAEIYRQKSSVATLDFQNPDIDEALRFAYLAEEESPTYGTAIAIAEIEDYEKNNYEAAIRYYRLYLDRLTDIGDELNPGDREFYQNRISELEALL